MRGDDERDPNPNRWSPSGACNDVEMGGHQPGPVVFNNRLDVPSIRSSSDVRPWSSKDGSHREASLPDSAFDEQLADDGSSVATSGASGT